MIDLEGWEPRTGDTVRVTRGDGWSPMDWVVKSSDRDSRTAWVDLARGSLLGPQREHWASLGLVRLAPGTQAQEGNVTVTVMSGGELEVVTVDEAGKPTISVYSDEDWAALIEAARVLGVR